MNDLIYFCILCRCSWMCKFDDDLKHRDDDDDDDDDDNDNSNDDDDDDDGEE